MRETESKHEGLFFCSLINRTAEIWENKGLTLNEAGNLVTKDMKKDEVSNTFFTSVLTDKICPEELQAAKTSRKV